MESINVDKLFRELRLNPADPQQKKMIQARLAAMQIEQPEEYEVLKERYEEKEASVSEELIPEVVEPTKEEKTPEIEDKEVKKPAKKATKKSTPKK